MKCNWREKNAQSIEIEKKGPVETNNTKGNFLLNSKFEVLSTKINKSKKATVRQELESEPETIRTIIFR